MELCQIGDVIELECKYLQSTATVVRILMGRIEDSLRETFFPALFMGGGEVNTDLRKILSHSVKRCGLGIFHPRSSVESAYNTSKEASR